MIVRSNSIDFYLKLEAFHWHERPEHNRAIELLSERLKREERVVTGNLTN